MTTHQTQAASPKGLVMHAAARHYDLIAWLLTLGRERALRERMVDLARLAPGESVLDVGCGTGSLAIAAKRRVGFAGTVHGIDASFEMFEQARRKAARAGVDVTFGVGTAEALPFPDASFDVVLSTLMLHHLPRAVRETLAREIRRVLRPGGRVLAVDFEPPARGQRGLIARVHRHGHVPLREIVELLEGAGLHVVERGSVGVSDLRFALATAPREGETRDAPPVDRALPPLSVPHWPVAVAAVATVAIVAGHAALLRSRWPGIAPGALAALVGVAVLAHVGLFHGARAITRHRKRP